MRCVFLGTPQFAVKALEGLVSSSHDVISVVTIPDKPMGRGQRLGTSAIKEFSLKAGIPLLQPESLKDDGFINDLRRLEADIFVVVAFKILPKIVFSLPKFGTLNVHASLLPKYRGAAPINWAIMNGEKETGVTTILIDAKVDTGDMLLQRRIEILPDMSAGQLHDRLAELGGELLVESLDKLENNLVQPVAQTHHAATKAPKLTREIMKINFTKNDQEVHNQIRGLSPFPGAYCHFRDKTIKLLNSKIEKFSQSEYQIPGTVAAIDKDSFVLCCGDGWIRIWEVQPEGKQKMSSGAFINGSRLEINEKFY